MADSFDLILAGGTVVNQDGTGVRDIGILDGKIAAIGGLSGASAGEAIDCHGLHVLPGVIDTQVHFREPGFTHKEDLETGSAARAPRGAALQTVPTPAGQPLAPRRRGPARVAARKPQPLLFTLRGWAPSGGAQGPARRRRPELAP